MSVWPLMFRIIKWMFFTSQLGVAGCEGASLASCWGISVRGGDGVLSTSCLAHFSLENWAKPKRNHPCFWSGVMWGGYSLEWRNRMLTKGMRNDFGQSCDIFDWRVMVKVHSPGNPHGRRQYITYARNVMETCFHSLKHQWSNDVSCQLSTWHKIGTLGSGERCCTWPDPPGAYCEHHPEYAGWQIYELWQWLDFGAVWSVGYFWRQYVFCTKGNGIIWLVMWGLIFL